MLGFRLAAFLILMMCAACGGPVAPPQPASGKLIAFGGGPGGPRHACFTCHGFRGQGDGAAPRLAGLEAGYIAKQMADYAHETRPDDVMTPIAQRMRDGDRRAVARYYASLGAPERTRGALPLALYHERVRGMRACAQCHGEAGEGRGAGNPALAGQPAAYTIEQLRRWRRGVRRNDARDVMGAVTRSLNDAEIEALAAYIERM